MSCIRYHEVSNNVKAAFEDTREELQQYAKGVTTTWGFMHKHKRYTKGFTLVELLITISITMILAAVAVPSVMSSQNGMRMLELDNAAASIANAAQNQMTSMKVSGTWIGMLESDPDYEDQAARFFPYSESSTDIYFFTADQARSNGVLPSLSVEEHILSGDFIIEYSRSTATVCGVFYSDGKNGVFEEASNSGTPAQDYYDAMASGIDREQEYRMANKPMIGYFYKAPAEEIEAVALRDPSIWIHDLTRRLCVQNPNLALSDLNTTLDVTVTLLNSENVATEHAFVLQNMQRDSLGNPSSFKLSLKNDLTGGIDVDPSSVVNLIKRSPNSALADVFEIDLNLLLKVASNSDDAALQQLASVFVPGSSLRIDAQVSTVEKDTIPATATAQAKWPSSPVLFTMLVTDPNLDSDKASHITGTYTAPVIKVTDSQGADPVVYPDTIDDNKEYTISTVNSLTRENAEAGRQAYSGKSILVSSAVETQAHLSARMGIYRSSLTNNKYTYQINEIWLNGVKIGYLKNSLWTWTDIGEKFAACMAEGPQAGKETKNVKTVRVDPEALANMKTTLSYEQLQQLGVLVDESYVLHIRTAPPVSDVQKYVVKNKEALWTLSSMASTTNGVISSRTVGIPADINDKNVRMLFENEFGAPSSVASWSFMYSAMGSETSINEMPEGLRYYYAITPAIGFDGAETLSEANKLIDNAYLWYFQYDTSSRELAEQPQATVHKPQVDDGLSPYAMTTAGDTGSTGADFELSHMQDALFCRVLFYKDRTSGAQIAGYTPQYVPHDSQDKEKLYHAPKSISTFVYWTTQDAYLENPKGRWLVCPEKANVNSIFTIADTTRQGKTLSWGHVDLYAATASMGMVYFENYTSNFNGQGAEGYYGYVYYQGSEILINQNMDNSNATSINNWGYYAIIPEGQVISGHVPDSSVASYTDNTFVNDGITYRCYAIAKTVTAYPHETRSYYLSGVSGAFNPTFYLNYNFAKAVQVNKAVADGWGSSQGNPYLIRHISQFIGCVNSSVQTNYLNKSFLQEHNIAFGGSWTSPSYNDSFRGAYEGYNEASHSNNEIQNYNPSIRGNELASSNNAIVGLFYKTDGATISNVSITNPQKCSWTNTITGVLTARYPMFGYFAGQATNSTFNNCVVVGNMGTHTSDNEYDVKIHYKSRVGSSIWLRPLVGGIVGETSNNTTLRDCYVSNLKIQLTRETTGVSATRYQVGGLIGRAASSTSIAIQNRSILVNDTTLSIDISRWSFDSFVGALVGTAPDNRTISWPSDPGKRYINVISQVDSEKLGESSYLGGTF